MTKDETKDKLKAALAGVEKDENGHIIVLSPYGLRRSNLMAKNTSAL